MSEIKKTVCYSSELSGCKVEARSNYPGTLLLFPNANLVSITRDDFVLLVKLVIESGAWGGISMDPEGFIWVVEQQDGVEE